MTILLIKITVQREVINQCSCYSTILPLMTKGKKPCLTYDNFTCQMDIYQSFVSQAVIDSCSQDCNIILSGLILTSSHKATFQIGPLECDTVRYETSVTLADWPTEFFCSTVINEFSSIRNQVSNYSTLTEKCDAIRKTYSFLNIYYDSLSYTYIEESPKMTMTVLYSSKKQRNQIKQALD